MSTSRIGALLATAAIVSIVTGPAAGDEEHGWWPRWGMERMLGGHWGPGLMGWWRSDGVFDHVDERLAYMKTELKIAPEQTATWDAFAAVVRTSVEAHNSAMRSMAKEFDAGTIFDKPLPERLGWQIAQMEARVQQIRPVKEAADNLYSILTDEQKAVADDIVLPMTGMGMGRSRARHMMRW